MYLVQLLLPLLRQCPGRRVPTSSLAGIRDELTER
jgi:hypothetical protein